MQNRWSTEKAANKALLDKISLFCLRFEHEGFNCATVLDKDFAISTLHTIPEAVRNLGTPAPLTDLTGQIHQCHIHGICSMMDYVVFKKDNGRFEDEPGYCAVELLDKYIAVSFPMGGKEKPYVRSGSISSASAAPGFFYYGDSGGPPDFSGGGVFSAINGLLLGIARGSRWDGEATHQYGDVLEIIPAVTIAQNIAMFGGKPFKI